MARQEGGRGHCGSMPPPLRPSFPQFVAARDLITRTVFPADAFLSHTCVDVGGLPEPRAAGAAAR